MLTNFQISRKTAKPFCSFDCCGNKFGRIESHGHAKVHSGINRIKKSRRYAKHVENQIVRKMILREIEEQ